MIKISVEERKVKHNYPCIMENPETGLIVLFIAKSIGIALREDEVAEYRTDWITNNFKKIDGKIILENKP